MKRNYLKSLLLLAAMVWAVPKTAAAEYELTVNTTPEWKTTFTTPTAAYAQGMAVGSDGCIYTIDHGSTVSGYKGFYRISSSGVTGHSFGINTASYRITNDEAFNIFATREGVKDQITDIRVWNSPTTDMGSKTAMDLSDVTLGSPYHIWAEGDVKNGTGYIWYVEPNGTVVNRVTVTKMKADKVMSWPLVDANGNTITLGPNENFVHKYDLGKLYIHSRSKAVYDVAVDESKAVCTPIYENNATDGYTYVACVGGGIKMFKGHKLLFVPKYGDEYGSGTKYTSKFMIYDITDGNKTLLATIDDLKSANTGTVGIWVRAFVNPDDENKLDIYTYKPGVGAAKYSITAVSYTDPVQSLEAARAFNDDASQTVTLTWAAPATGADHVTGYTIYKDGMQAATVAAGVTTWVDNAFTATTTYNVVPTYDTGETGTDATKAVTFYEFKAPTNLKATHFDGYARVTVTYSKVAKCDGLFVRYEVIRNDNAIVTGLVQGEYVDTYIPPGEHTYTVEAVFYKQDADGRYTVEIKRLRSDEQVTVTVNQLTATLVNYTLEEVYNHEMWDIWDADRANGSKLPDNFNPNLKEGSTYIDAEHYRQGALVTDADGKKWWYIMQRSNSLTKESTNGTSSGILKISAEDDQLKAGGNASMLTLPTEIKHAQSVGIATDASGNIFVRGWNQKYDDLNDWTYNNTHNYIGKLLTGVIYSADLTKSFNVSFENIDFDTESVIAENADSKERIDYYRVSGDLMGTAYLYVVAGCSRTMTVVKLVNDGTTVTATQEYQYTPTKLDSGTEIKVSASDGYENYAFPIEETLAGSKGYVYQKRSVAYLYVPDGSAGENHDIYTSEGKIANSGGTTAKMSNANEATAAQLFLITPQSFYSRNIGSFSIGLVPENKFTNAVVPIANYVQQGSENINADGEADNCNGNWLFAEWDEGDTGVTGDENLYIYQYVPGIRIAKYRLYGNVSFYPSAPELTIETKHDENREHITHFEATATWGTPADYNQAGDYAIRYYNVELLDAGNNVIDSRQVPATENGSDWKGEFSKQTYSVTFSTTADLNAGTGVATGDSDNHFVDNASLYSVRVTPVYDLTQVLRETTSAASDLRSAATMTSQDTHDYEMNTPSGTVQIYKGTGAVKNVYRVEIDITNMEDGEEPVSHYELSYSYTPSATARSGETVTVPINDFILVTADSQTENSSVVPGVNVRNGNNGYGLSGDSQEKSYVMFYVDNRLFEDRDGNGYGEYYYPEETAEQIPSNWTYNLTAVYAAGNSLLRNSTTAAMDASEDMIETGVETADAGEEVAFSAFPIPAESTLTVRAPQGIESISIISAAGVEVKSVAGNGDGVMTIAVDDLPSGHYLLRVNNLTPIKIVKR